VDWKFIYRVEGSTVTPVRFETFDIVKQFALLLLSIVLTVVLKRVLMGFFKWGLAEAKSDKAPPPGP
jgi:hypothetical protein